MKLLLFFIFLASWPALAQEASVRADIEPKVVAPGQGFLLSVVVNSEASVSAEQPELPDISPLVMQNAFSSSETRSIFQNGKFQVTRAQTFSYELSAVQVGEYTVGPITVVVNGQVYRTQPVKVMVSGSGQNNRNYGGGQNQNRGGGGRALPPDVEEEEDPYQEMDDMFQQLLRRRLDRLQRGAPRGGGSGGGNGTGIVSPADLKDAYYVEVEVDKTKVYVGEQVTVSWYLVTRAQISDIDTLKYPAVEGFWREDIELATRLNFRPEVINGITYQKALLASFALFPLKAGVSKIDEYTARCNVLAMGSFGITGQQTVVKSSQVVPITVLPLPTENKPTTFTGAVGEFRVSGRLADSKIVTNSPFEFKVRFEGKGNAKNIEIPKLPLPDGVDLYDTKSQTKYFADGRSFKEFDYILVAKTVGAKTIPPVAVSFFNPVTKKYYTESTQAVSFDVAQGEKSNTIESKPIATTAEPVSAKPALPQLVLQVRESEIPVAQKMWAWGAFLLVGFIYIGIRGVKEFRSSEKRESLAKIVKEKFKTIDSLSAKGEMRNAAVEATNLVYLILGELSGLGGASRELSVLLEKSPPSYRREVGPALSKIMQKLEVLAFAPSELSGNNIAEQKTLLADVEKMLKKSLEYNFEEENV